MLFWTVRVSDNIVVLSTTGPIGSVVWSNSIVVAIFCFVVSLLPESVGFWVIFVFTCGFDVGSIGLAEGGWPGSIVGNEGGLAGGPACAKNIYYLI